MKLAVTAENGQVFQHFGHTKMFKLFTVEDGKVTAREDLDTSMSGHEALAVILKQKGVSLLICGGIGGGAQNALAQAKQFAEVANVNGIILTKLDGTAKGGIAVAIQSELDIPVKYIGVGETIDDLQKFDADAFVNALFDIDEKDLHTEE